MDKVRQKYWKEYSLARISKLTGTDNLRYLPLIFLIPWFYLIFLALDYTQMK
jgi:hypothetical protein